MASHAGKPTSEKRKSYNSRYQHEHYKTAQDIDRSVKVVYPDCGMPDRMSKAEYRRHIGQFPAGSMVYIDGHQLVILQNGAAEKV
jgi:hypothetical protein